VVTQLLPFLLLASLSVAAIDADVKRVFQMRGAFLLLDFDDPSIESIKGLVLRCLIHPAYLRSTEGKRFLSFLFTINQGAQFAHCSLRHIFSLSMAIVLEYSNLPPTEAS
jgi:condensin-2 complex subunit G2